jgi:hypothetical protein
MVAPLSTALDQRKERLVNDVADAEGYELITLHFDGSMEARAGKRPSDIRGTLYAAYAGDVLYSKIDARHGAIGIVPPDLPRVAVTSEYPVYCVRAGVASPNYVRLLLRSRAFQEAINSMVAGAGGRKRVAPRDLEAMDVPLPPRDVQERLTATLDGPATAVAAARSALDALQRELDATLHERADTSALYGRSIAVHRRFMNAWDSKSARAGAFREANPDLKALGSFAEEATMSVRPWEEGADADWHVYGVNNRSGVFLNHAAPGRSFKAAYKRIEPGWFFHNPTRAIVGSLGRVPDRLLPRAVTSPEYQVWRVPPERGETLAEFIEAVLRTPFFLKLVDVHRVGAVKQRLFVQDLLRIPLPVLSPRAQGSFIARRRGALSDLRRAEAELERAQDAAAAALAAGRVPDYAPSTASDAGSDS